MVIANSLRQVPLFKSAGSLPPTSPAFAACCTLQPLEFACHHKGQWASQKYFVGSFLLVPVPKSPTFYPAHSANMAYAFQMSNSNLNLREKGISFSLPDRNQNFTVRSWR
jgi:hypothetical protein